MNDVIKNFMKNGVLEERLNNVSIGHLALIVNETVQMAEEEYSMICGTLEPSLFTRKYAGFVKEKALNGVKFIIISDRTVKCTGSGNQLYDALYNPLLALLDEKPKDHQIYKNLTFLYTIHGPPALHFIVVDDKLALVEAQHSETDNFRDVALFKKKKVIKALDSKIHFDVGEKTMTIASRSTGYYFFGDEPKFVRNDPFEWIDNAVQKEIIDYEEREANFRKLTKGYEKKDGKSIRK